MKLYTIVMATSVILASEGVKALNFTQPLLWQDLADVDLIRVNETYYYSASNMHFSPGAPILRSYDLVNWEYLSHSIPVLDFNEPKFSLQGGNAYNQGVYASSLRYHEAKGDFYWAGCIQGTGRTYIYSAPDIEGPWRQASVIEDYCLYDNGLLIDDDGTFYMSYGRWVPDGTEAKTWVAQLTTDLQVQQSDVVFNTTAELGYIEGSRFYKINGTYYIWLTNPGVGRGQIMIKSSNGPFGPYDQWHRVLENSGMPVTGAGPPFQGALIDTPNGNWWYMAFVDRWPGGRLPVLAPITWDSNGWPNVDFVSENTWGSSYEYPLPHREIKPVVGTDRFHGTSLGPQYEWNHNPDNTKWSIDNGLKLNTATVTNDFFAAQNTLTHRILGPQSSVTVELDLTNMVDGNCTGLAIFHHAAGWIGVSKTGDTTTVQMVDNIVMDATGGWHTTKKGDVVDSKSLLADKIWLRVQCDISASPNYSKFSYSLDGGAFIDLGQVHETYDDGSIWFLGARVGIFNYATKKLDGSVLVKSFTIGI